MDYSYSRLNNLSTNDLIEFILKVDNGFFDNELVTCDHYNKIEKYRSECISIMCNRYHNYYSQTKSKNIELDGAYNLYLKYYI